MAPKYYLHVLFTGTFVVTVGAVKWFEAFMNRVLVSDQVSPIRKAFITLLTGPGS